MSPTTNPSTVRRLLPVGVAFVLFFGSSAALAAIEDEPTQDGQADALADPSPEYSFVVPEIRLGDKMVYDEFFAIDPRDRDYYEAEEEDDEGNSTDHANRTEEVEFARVWNISLSWKDHGAFRLPDGTEVDAQALEYYQGGGEDDYWAWDLYRSYVYDGGTDRRVAVEVAAADTGQSPGWGMPLLVNDVGASLAFASTDYMDEVAPDCIFSGLLAGKVVSKSVTLRLPACSGATVQLEGPLDLRYVGSHEFQGRPALGFHGAHPAGNLTLWLAEGLPYPIAIDQALHDSGEEDADYDEDYDGCDPCLTRWVLSAFAAGDTPRGGSSTSRLAAEPMPDVGFDASGELLIDDSGVASPFTLTEAWAAAKGPATDPDAALFFLTHPDVVVVYAGFTTIITNDLPAAHWTIYATDGADVLYLGISRVVVAGLPRELQPVYVDAQEREPIDLPDLQDLPSEAPSVQDLFARAAWHEGQQGDCYGYSFLPDDHLPEDEATERYFVGKCDWSNTARPETSPPGLNNSMATDYALTAFDGQGEATSRMAHVMDFSTGMYATPSLGAGGGWDGWDDEDDGPLAAIASVLPSAGHTATAGAIALGGGLLVWLLFAAKSGPFFGLFSRLREDRLLEHPVRRRVMEVIEARPGIHFKELERATALANGALVHHARVLVEGGLVAVRRGQGYSCYFPASADAGAVASAASLKAEGARRILQAIAKNPASSALEIGLATGLSPGTIHHHVQRLSAAGLVRATRNGRQLALEATPLASAALAA